MLAVITVVYSINGKNITRNVKLFLKDPLFLKYNLFISKAIGIYKKSYSSASAISLSNKNEM